MEDRDYFVINTDSLDILDEMSREQAGRLIKLIYEYYSKGTITTDDPAMKKAVEKIISVE